MTHPGEKRHFFFSQKDYFAMVHKQKLFKHLGVQSIFTKIPAYVACQGIHALPQLLPKMMWIASNYKSNNYDGLVNVSVDFGPSFGRQEDV